MENNQEDFLYKKEEKEDPIYVMTVELEKGKSETIKIFQNSKPEFLAYEFCKKHNLDFNSLSYLTNKIKELLEKIPNQTIEIRKSISINNEPIEELDEEYNPPSEILLKKSVGSFNKKISINSNENLNSEEKNNVSNNDDKIDKEKNLESFSRISSKINNDNNNNNENKNFEDEILNSESNKNCESKENYILNMNVENEQNKKEDNINNNNNNIKIDENLNNNFENKNINNYFKNKNLKSSFHYSNIYLFLEKKLKKEEEKRKKIEEENNFNNNDDYNIYDNINYNNNNKNREIFETITKKNRNKLFNYKKFYENFKESIQLKNNSIQNSNFIENNSSNLNILNDNNNNNNNNNSTNNNNNNNSNNNNNINNSNNNNNNNNKNDNSNNNNNNNNNLINYSNNENINISYNNINKLNYTNNNINNFIIDSKNQITSKSVDKKLKNLNRKKSSSKKLITLSQNNNNFDNYMNKNYAIFDEIFQAKVEDLNLFKKKPKHILKSKSESNKKIFFDNFNNEKNNKLKNDYIKKNNKTNFIFASNFNFFSPQNVKKNVKYLKNNINYINKKNKNKIINTSKSSRNFEKNKENNKKLFSPFLYENKKEKLLNENSKCSTKSNCYKNKILSSYRNYYSNDSKINLNDYQIENMFIKIFKLLDKDNDNKINILNLDIKNIPTTIYNLTISPIINKLKIRNNEINLKDFCEIGINKFKYFPIKKKKILINFTNNL